MKNWWIKLGCYLTGYNYQIVKNSSEVTAKAVKKYTSALLIVSMLWAFIGYAFTNRYINDSITASVVGAIIMVIIVIQIERQIILTVGKNRLASTVRFFIAIVMAGIGSIIIDQVLFKEDVEKKKLETVQLDLNRILPMKTNQLSDQIFQLDSLIGSKEVERIALMDEISKRPMINSVSRTYKYEKDTLTGKNMRIPSSLESQSVPNPKAEFIPKIDEQIASLQAQKGEKEGEIINVRADLESELNKRIGFLDELQILISILLSSNIALIVWIMMFLFLGSIELFVLLSKSSEGDNDYIKTIKHQNDVRMEMLNKLKAA